MLNDMTSHQTEQQSAKPGETLIHHHHNHHHHQITRDSDSHILHSSSLSSPSSLIINEESPASLSQASSPQCSSNASNSGRSSSSRSTSPDPGNTTTTTTSKKMHHNTKSESHSSPTINNNNVDQLTVDSIPPNANSHIDKPEHTLIQPSDEDLTEKEKDMFAGNQEALKQQQTETLENNMSGGYSDVNVSKEAADNLVIQVKEDVKEEEEEDDEESVSKTGEKQVTPDSVVKTDVVKTTSELEMTTGNKMQQQSSSYDKYESMQPRLKKFLKIYQLSSKNSLGGPVSNDVDNLNTSKHVETGEEKQSERSRSRTPDSMHVGDESPGKTIHEIPYGNGSHTIPQYTTVSHQSQHNNNDNNEHNNLSIIASVAAAAYFNQALNKQSLDLSSKLFTQSKDKSPQLVHRPSLSIDQAPMHHQQHHQNNNSQNHHNHHPHKRIKYSSAFSKPPGKQETSRDSSLNNSMHSQNAGTVSGGGGGGSGSLMAGRSASSVNYLKCVKADSNTSPLIETLLHGERISCFVVGGEKRLCLHDILNTILKDFSVQQINSACQKLQIACLESSIKQLEILKKSKLLPTGAPNCGLLTQTNAERLCAYLMDNYLSQQGPPPSTSPGQQKQKLKVVHECFGKTYGHLFMHLYSRSDSACIECDTCRKLYTPKNFVCHSHRYESHTRHWGFDSANWRMYLKLAHSGVSAASSSSETSGILSDIKNKDNIAANQSGQSKSVQQEDFEQFKKKFLNKDDISGILINGTSVADVIKRKLQPENSEIEHRQPHKHLAHHYGSENSAKRLMTNSVSLNDLNNNLMKNAISNSTNPNTITSTPNKSLSEHKLLNGLLSKPLGIPSTTTGQNSDPNTQNLLIPSNTSFEQIIKMNKLNGQRPGKHFMNEELAMGHGAGYSNKPCGAGTNSLLSLINGQQHSPQKLLQQATPKEAYMGGHRLLGSGGSTISSMEANMLELILGEIEGCVENKESVERLRQMITQMHIYFNEKLNELQLSRSKLIAEFDEHKMNYQTENEQLRCQLKLLQIHSDMSNKDHYQKPPASSNPTNQASSLSQHLSQQQQQQLQQQASQQQAHLQQQLKQQEAAAAFKTMQTNKTSPINQQQSMFNAQQHFQMLLQQQQVMQHNKSTQETMNAAAAVAAAQSFPQFFLNHYVPQLQQHRQQPNLAIDPSSAQKSKHHSSASSFSSPSSHSNSSSPASLNNKSQSSSSLNLNGSHLHQTIA